MTLRIGIDLGGTKIAAVALDRSGAVVASRRVPTPQDYGETLDALAGVVRGIEAELDARASVGIGTPGAGCPDTGIMRYAENTGLEGRPFLADICGRLERTVKVANDANCFALSEATDGAGAGAEVVLGVILGTGVGAGLVVHGRALAGVNGLAGEWGHSPLPWPGEGELDSAPCYCGRTGCIEMFLAGPAIAADHLRVTGRAASSAEVVTFARGGEPGARATLERFLDRLARSLAPVVSLLDPAVIVFGGGVSKTAEIYAELPARMAPWVAFEAPRTRVLPSVHGDASGVRGAAWLWSPADWERGLPGAWRGSPVLAGT